MAAGVEEAPTALMDTNAKLVDEVMSIAANVTADLQHVKPQTGVGQLARNDGHLKSRSDEQHAAVNPTARAASSR